VINNQHIHRARKAKLAQKPMIQKDMGKRTSFLKGRSPNGQKPHEVMVNILGHKGNANQNHVTIPSHSC
jgi:hypothetical protein